MHVKNIILKWILFQMQSVTRTFGSSSASSAVDSSVGTRTANKVVKNSEKVRSFLYSLINIQGVYSYLFPFSFSFRFLWGGREGEGMVSIYTPVVMHIHLSFFGETRGGGKQLVRYTMILSVIFVFRHKHHPPPAVGTISTI